MSETILLDTHVAIWLSEGTLPADSLATIIDARLAGQALVSPATAWEAGLLAKRGRYVFEPDPQGWFSWLLVEARLSEALLSSRILIDASQLPSALHDDPADRMLIATARTLDCALMTRDAEILAYAAQGHVKAIPC